MRLDIFPTAPGPEILTSWANIFSWVAFTVHDLDGNLLYQFWHDGGAGRGATQWLSEPGLLVVPAAYCTHEPWRISKHLPENCISVPVVFAIRPVLGQIDNELLAVPERAEWSALSVGRDTAVGPRRSAEWYKFVWPLHRDYVLVHTAHRMRPALLTDNNSSALISLNMMTSGERPPVGCFWIINERGDTIAEGEGGDPYRKARDFHGEPLPPPEQYRLVDLDTLLADPFGEIAFGTATDAPAPPLASE